MSRSLVKFVVLVAVVTSLGLLVVNLAEKLKQQSIISTSKTGSEFEAGKIYYRNPSDGRLIKLGTVETSDVTLPLGGFDIKSDKLVYTDNASTLTIVDPSGSKFNLPLNGLYHASRPSISPDGAQVALQASEVFSPTGNPANLNIYTVNLDSGDIKRISSLPSNEESPEWFPQTNKIAYSSFSVAGVNLHIYDIDQSKELLSIPDAGAIHLAVSPDERTVLDVGRLRLYDLETTNFVRLKDMVTVALLKKGFDLDVRYVGQAGRGTFPLDGSFAGDPTKIIFDGAVKQGNNYGYVVCQVNIDGSGFQVLTELIPGDASKTNNNNYSQLNPTWL